MPGSQDVFRRVVTGDPLEIPAAAYNAFVDAAEAEIGRKAGFNYDPSDRSGGDSGVTPAKISVSGGVSPYHAVALRALEVDPSEVSNFRSRALWTGVTPDESDEVLAITIDAGPNGTFRNVLIDGVAPVKVKVIDETHTHARGDVATGTAMLTSDDFGPAEILWKQDVADRDVSDEAWCVIRLGAGLEPKWFVLTASTPDASPPTKFVYSGKVGEQAGTGYDGWQEISGAPTVSLYHTLEEVNNGAGVEGTGIDIDGTDFPADYELQPVPAGTPVLAHPVVTTSGSVEWWFTATSNYDGDCDALDSGSAVIQAARFSLSATAGSFTTTDVVLPFDRTDVAQSWANNTSGVIRINEAGTYMVTADVTMDELSGNNRTEFQSRLLEDSSGLFVDVPGTTRRHYSRNSAQGAQSASMTALVVLTGSTQIEVLARRVTGSNTGEFLGEGSQITIVKLA